MTGRRSGAAVRSRSPELLQDLQIDGRFFILVAGVADDGAVDENGVVSG